MSAPRTSSALLGPARRQVRARARVRNAGEGAELTIEATVTGRVVHGPALTTSGAMRHSVYLTVQAGRGSGPIMLPVVGEAGTAAARMLGRAAIGDLVVVVGELRIARADWLAPGSTTFGLLATKVRRINYPVGGHATGASPHRLQREVSNAK